ncbi:unnamed protein product [Protopolystoma xenopodis]|uniref:Uncharacterized protein n=1 Tax=Protopolystoma xenopodis TaxID=117903 RepID=A0A448XGK2_9PLAT|nr:unnamed protein product [Protopolystoma xenopodis]
MNHPWIGCFAYHSRYQPDRTEHQIRVCTYSICIVFNPGWVVSVRNQTNWRLGVVGFLPGRVMQSGRVSAKPHRDVAKASTPTWPTLGGYHRLCEVGMMWLCGVRTRLYDCSERTPSYRTGQLVGWDQKLSGLARIRHSTKTCRQLLVPNGTSITDTGHCRRATVSNRIAKCTFHI